MEKVVNFLISSTLCISLLGYSIPIVRYISFFCLIILLLIRVNHPQKIRYGFQTKLMIFWTVYILLLGTQTSDVILFIQRFPTLLIGTLATYIFNYFITDIDQVEKIIRPISLSLIINIILGFMQVIANIYIFSDSTSLFYGTRVPIGAFNNANDFATALIFMLFMQIFIIFRQKSLPKRIMHSILFLLGFILLIPTQSRANLLAMLIGAFIWIFFKLMKERKKIVGLLLLVNFGIVIVLGVTIAIYSGLYNRFTSTFIDGFQNSDQLRFNLIKNGVHLFIKSKGIGIGFGEVEARMATESMYPTWGIFNLHNFWLEILVSSGLLIFVLYVFNYLQMIIKSLKKYLESNKLENTKSNLYILTAVSLIVFIISGVSTSTLFIISNMWVWIVLAFFNSIVNIQCAEKKGIIYESLYS